jgi:hypothetical protein
VVEVNLGERLCTVSEVYRPALAFLALSNSSSLTSTRPLGSSGAALGSSFLAVDFDEALPSPVKSDDTHRQQLVCMVRRDSSLPAAGPAVLAMDTVLATDVLDSVLCIDVVDEPDGVEGVESYTLL